AREGLEDGLALVMRVLSAQVVDVQRDLRVIDEAAEELGGEVDVEAADERARERHVPLQPGTSGEIDDDARERLVERNVGMAVATDALLVADRARDRLAERDADVLDRVVRVDVQVAFALDLQIDESVTRDLVEHVVEERHAAGELALAGAVEIDEDPHAGLGGIAADFGAAHRVPEE